MNVLTQQDSVIHVPFLIKGQLVLPPQLSRAEAEAAFATGEPGSHYRKLPHAQILREVLIDHPNRRYSSEFRYQVLPALDPLALIETNPDELAQNLYPLTTTDLLGYLQQIASALVSQTALVNQVHDLCRATSELPAALLDLAFAGFQSGLDVAAATQMIDAELGLWGQPGRNFLDGWVAVPGQPLPAITALLAYSMHPAATPPAVGTSIRAVPTRQLHITAGNAPSIPLVSALRVVLSKSAGVIKLPAAVTLTGALFAVLAQAAAPDHPLTRHLSVVYWPGGDEMIEQVLFAPGAFDRVVVWGAPGAVHSVQSRALFTRTISFNPRYGAGLIGREAFAGDLAQIAARSAADALIYNQKACNATFVQYIEGSDTQVAQYAEALRAALASWDALAPQVVAPAALGQLKRMRRGRYTNATWQLNAPDGEFASGVVVMPDEFDMLDHPLCRLVALRRVDTLDDALALLHPGVSTVGVYPEARRLALRDRIAARGVSNIVPLGECERLFAGMPHDGMLVLSQLVEWKQG